MTGLDPPLIARSVEAARQRKADALAEYEAASAELAWWLKGAELAGLAVVREDDEEPDLGHIEELFPAAAFFDETGTRPTLRQAVVAYFREHPDVALSHAELAQALIERGWLAEEDAQKRVSDVAVVMRRDKQLERVDRGVVRLHPQLKIPLEQLDATQGTSTDPD